MEVACQIRKAHVCAAAVALQTPAGYLFAPLHSFAYLGLYQQVVHTETRHMVSSVLVLQVGNDVQM